MNRVDLQAQWLMSLSNEGGRRLCATMSPEQMREIAADVVAHDANHENALVEAALRMIAPDSPPPLESVYEHQLNLVRREAAWKVGRLDLDSFRRQLHVVGGHWLKEAQGAPTVNISAMQVFPTDGIAVSTCLFPDRRLAFYGEGLMTENYAHVAPTIELIRQGIAGVRAADSLLEANGVFNTFPDFVHEGHGTVVGSLFGVPRPFASGFAQLCARKSCVLIPINVDCRLDRIDVEILEPTQMPDVPSKELRSESNLVRLTQFIGNTLQQLIRKRPESWALLNTLSMHCEQMPQVA
jgi:hypothetical protein